MRVIRTVGGTVLADNLFDFETSAYKIVAQFDRAVEPDGYIPWFSERQFVFRCDGIVRIGDRIALEYNEYLGGGRWTARPLKKGETI